MKCGNLAGSRRKKTGVLLATISQLPSSVRNLTEKPLGSRAQSGEPDSPPTVENRAVTEHSFPSLLKISAKQRSSRGLVHLKTPCAPLPLAWTTLSGILSRSKWESKSIKWKSWSRRGPLVPPRCVSYGWDTGSPLLVEYTVCWEEAFRSAS